MRQSIVCESPVPDSTVKINFSGMREKKQQYRIYCCERYTYCELYRATMEKYREDETDV